MGQLAEGGFDPCRRRVVPSRCKLHLPRLEEVFTRLEKGKPGPSSLVRAASALGKRRGGVGHSRGAQGFGKTAEVWLG